MAYKKLISVLENEIGNIVKKWTVEVQKSEYTEAYKELDKSELSKRGENLYANLIKWLGDGAHGDLRKYFEHIGAQRNKEGFPLSEVIFALYLSKKALWDDLFPNDEIITTLDKKESLETIHLLNNYFDRGNFFIMRGYLNELISTLGKTQRFTKEELKSMLMKGALYKESMKQVNELLYDIGFTAGVIR